MFCHMLVVRDMLFILSQTKKGGRKGGKRGRREIGREGRRKGGRERGKNVG